jgi:ABC-type glycerol-3-phosphate transport system substrate-binding protein
MAKPERMVIQMDDDDIARASGGGGVTHSAYYEAQRAKLLLQAASGQLPALSIERSRLSEAIAAAGGASGLEDVNEKFRQELEQQREALLAARRAVGT